MNAMELLKNEINKKRKLANDLIRQRVEGDNGDAENNNNDERLMGFGSRNESEKRLRYFRQSDLIKQQEEEAIQKRLLAEIRQQEANQQKTQMEEQQQQQQQNGVNQQQQNQNNSQANENNPHEKMLHQLSTLTIPEIKNRLRLLGHPVTLFGETDRERIQRLVSIQLDEENNEINYDDYRLTAIGHETDHHHRGRKDTSRRNHDNEDDDEEEDDEDDEGGDDHDDNDGQEKKNDNNRQQNHLNSNNTENKNNHKTKKDKINTTTNEDSDSYIRGNICTNYSSSNLTSEKIIYKYFRNLLKQWEWDLDDRDDYFKQTAKGKMETKTQKQCKDYIRPLFKLCKKREVPGDILIKLVKIVQYCEQGNFRLAHDEYLQAAIGNSAWPIGLTMVGIHERSGREKISTSKVAHVMNNEMQRKYFTSVKRLMTFAQSKRPDVPPSMKSL